jgi:hypothetical protein
MSTAESIPPEEPGDVSRRYFSVLYAAQDEINVRCGWIAQEEGFDRIERAVFGAPTIIDKIRSFGGRLLDAAQHIPPPN